MRRALALLTLCLGSGWAASAPTLAVQQGRLTGVIKNGVEQFLGVPFAAPPVGELRWQPPQPPAWQGQRGATTFGPVCAQGSSTRTPQGSEDCLTLNIYRPPQAQNAPLMVWVHGGFFTGGDSSVFDGSALAREYGVVVVTVNYRLGVFGFLAAPGVGDGNYGLMDIQAAVRWLRSNAQSIGFDPGNVTLFGQSAGAAAICGLMAAPSSAGLFQKAILQSGSCTSSVLMTSLNEARRVGARFTGGFRCGFMPLGACLRGKSTADITAVKLTGRSVIDPVPLPPVYGGVFVPEAPAAALAAGRGLNIPTLMGINREEGQIFEPFLPSIVQDSTLTYGLGLALTNLRGASALAQRYPIRNGEKPVRAVTRILTDQVFACPAWELGQRAGGAPVYFYEFSEERPPVQLPKGVSAAALGAYHGAELSYVLDTPVVGLANPEQFTEAQAKLSAQMGGYWTAFARTGQPQALGLRVWPVLSAGEQVLQLEAGKTQLSADFSQRHQCDWWNKGH